MYQALYRKWRPMVFSDVVGQRHVTDTLRKQIETNRLSHAYLFTGTRGTGKTTCAKILAKAANCLDPIGGEPCNKCSSCIGINNGSITDVSEIDAASYTGVDNIRAIRDETAYSPSEAKMRVYIIDECHMLTSGANNALLKTLEEPPSHVLFILATTELNKVPATILSRCQLFTFRRLQPEDIAIRIKEIAAAEKIPLEADAAELLARIADGALRDAISMLDQCAASTSGTIGTEQVLSVIGLSTASETLKLASALATGDSGTALNMLSEMYANGKDLAAVLNELAMLLRDLLILKTTNNSRLLLGNYDKSEIESIDISRIRLMSMINTIQDTLAGMKQSPNRRVDAELCLIKLCDTTLSEGFEGLAARVEHLENAYRNLGSAKVSSSFTFNEPDKASRSSPAPLQAKPDNPNHNNSNNKNEPSLNSAGSSYHKKEQHNQEANVGSAPRSAEAGEGSKNSAQLGEAQLWERILQQVKPKLEVSQFSFLSTIKKPVLQGSRLCIVTDLPVMQNILNKPEITNAIGEAASIILGKNIKADIIESERFNYKQTKLSDDDALQKLIERQNKFDNIKVDN
jgi:DNA polymerase-3 subunit gamma/tau